MNAVRVKYLAQEQKAMTLNRPASEAIRLNYMITMLQKQY